MDAVPGDFAGDQRRSDGEALTFDAAPVTAPEEIVGYPTVTVTVAADRPLALLAVRLCDVAPTGESLLVSYGLLNLAQRESQEWPQLLTPGEPVTVTIQLNVCAHRLAAGLVIFSLVLLFLLYRHDRRDNWRVQA